MAYSLKAGETVPESVKRIITEEVDSAIEHLEKGRPEERDEAIHEARKSVKKIRGVLRLIQPEISRSFYIQENKRLRDLGRKLSEIRDAAAIIEVFNGLADKYRAELREDVIASIRDGLHKNKVETESASNVDAIVRRAISEFKQLRKRLANVSLETDGWNTIGPGLRKYYRLGRKAMAIVAHDGTPENYHAWRKRAKDHWYHVRLLEKLWSDVMEAHEKSLKALESCLGDDHNLVVLKQKLGDDPARFGSEEPLELFTTLADRRGQELRKEAIELGQRVYALKPRRMEKNLAKLWHLWKAQEENEIVPPPPRKSSTSAKIVQPRATPRAS